MGYPEDNKVDPEDQERAAELHRKEVREELAARGYTEIDFEVMEARANRMLEELHINKVLKRVKLDFTSLIPPEKPGS